MPEMPASSSSPRAERPPQVPTRVPWLGHGLQFGRDPVALVSRCQQRYGDAFSLKFPGGRRIMLLNPLDYPAFFKEKRFQFTVVGIEVGEKAFGYGSAESGDHDMEEIIDVSGRLLKGKHLEPLGESMQRLFAKRLVELEGSGSSARRELLAWLQLHLFAAGAEALCGEGFYSPQVFRDYETFDRYFPLLLAGVPAKVLPGCVRARRRLAQAAGRERPGRAHVMKVRDELFAKLGMPQEEIDLHDAAFVWASQVNTLNSAFWALLHVLRDPTAREAVEAEVREVCGSTPLQGQAFTTAQLKQLVRLDSAISESLRIASGPMVTRRAADSFEFPMSDGRTLKIDKGDNLDLFPYLTHYDPEIYEQPHEFRYDRFLADPDPPRFYKGGERVAFNLLAFGSGASMCPGRFFARNEVKIILALLLTYFEIEIETQEVPALDFSRMGLGVLPPKNDVSFTIRRR